MAPCLRERKSVGASGASKEARSKPLSSLKGDEVAIDGNVYSLRNFVHPGGDVIEWFGGNDVTVQYKMIHPNHSGKELKKLTLTGEKLSNWVPEYAFGTPFEKDLKKEVLKIVGRGKEYGTPGYFARAAFYIALFTCLQFFWAYQYGTSFPLAILFGISQAFIGLNVQHDANHGAASKNPWVNSLLGFGADFIGGSKYTWISQHWTHHAYTNHSTKDPDAFSAEPLMTFNDYSPQDADRKMWYHKFQAFYFLPVLSFYWFTSVFNPQILDLKHAGADYVGIKMDNDYVKSKVPIAIGLRISYILMNVVAPFFHGNSPLAVLAHIWVMGVAESLCLSVLFSLSHNFEKSDRDPTAAFKQSGKKVCWYKSQVETSSTYGGAISGYLTGGLNFQIEHHLFPKMSSAWYPYIQPAVREVCKKHGVQYAYYDNAFTNLISTFKFMHAAGTGSNWEWEPLKGA